MIARAKHAGVNGGTPKVQPPRRRRRRTQTYISPLGAVVNVEVRRGSPTQAEVNAVSRLVRFVEQSLHDEPAPFGVAVEVVGISFDDAVNMAELHVRVTCCQYRYRSAPARAIQAGRIAERLERELWIAHDRAGGGLPDLHVAVKVEVARSSPAGLDHPPRQELEYVEF